MTEFEKKICEAFLSRFTGAQTSMRLRSLSIFPEFESASPDEKLSYLEAAEALARKGLVSLKWENYRKGEMLKTITCLNMEKLFSAIGVKNSKAQAVEIRAMIKERVSSFQQISPNVNGSIVSFLNYLADNFDVSDVGRGMNIKAAEDFVALLEFLAKEGIPGGLQSGNGQKPIALSSRALSVKLFNDSKRLEEILGIARPILTRAKKLGQSAPDLSLLERSLPETFIAGKLVFEYRAAGDDENNRQSSLVNSSGLVLGFPLSSVRKFVKIRTLESKESPRVLAVENKETFYALASSLSGYECVLYTGGYPNRAAVALIKILSASGFRFYHAGDLDPDGILILQNIGELAEKPVTPVGMDAATFDRYLPHARPLIETVLRQAAKITAETKAIPGIAQLLQRILETKKGVEQEVIEYKESMDRPS